MKVYWLVPEVRSPGVVTGRGRRGIVFSEGNPLELSNHNSRFLHLCQVSNNLMSPGTSKAGDVGYERVQCYIVSSCAVYVYCLKILHIF